MKRTSVVLPDELATLVDLERQRRNVSTAEIIRQALASYLGVDGSPPQHLSFIGIGASGYTDTASRMEEILAEEWGPDIRRDAGLDRDR